MDVNMAKWVLIYKSTKDPEVKDNAHKKAKVLFGFLPKSRRMEIEAAEKKPV